MASKTSATLLEGDALWIAYRKQMDAVLEKAKQEHRHCIVWSKDNVPMEDYAPDNPESFDVFSLGVAAKRLADPIMDDFEDARQQGLIGGASSDQFPGVPPAVGGVPDATPPYKYSLQEWEKYQLDKAVFEVVLAGLLKVDYKARMAGAEGLRLLKDVETFVAPGAVLDQERITFGDGKGGQEQAGDRLLGQTNVVGRNGGGFMAPRGPSSWSNVLHGESL